MERAVSATHTPEDADVDAPRSASIDLRQVTPDIDKVRLALESIASDLRSLWSEALVRRNLADIERLVGASHALHGAIGALAADNLIAARSSPPRAGREAASAELEQPCPVVSTAVGAASPLARRRPTDRRGGLPVSAHQPWQIARALGRVIVSARDTLEAESAEQLRAILGDLIEGQGNLDVVVDAMQVVSVGDRAIEVLVQASRLMDQVHGTLVISSARPEVVERLQVHGLVLSPPRPKAPDPSSPGAVIDLRESDRPRRDPTM